MSDSLEQVLRDLRALVGPEPSPHYRDSVIDGGVVQRFYLGCYGHEDAHHPGLGRAWPYDGEASWCRPYPGGYCQLCDPPVPADDVRGIMARLDALAGKPGCSDAGVLLAPPPQRRDDPQNGDE